MNGRVVTTVLGLALLAGLEIAFLFAMSRAAEPTSVPTIVLEADRSPQPYEGLPTDRSRDKAHEKRGDGNPSGGGGIVEGGSTDGGTTPGSEGSVGGAQPGPLPPPAPAGNGHNQERDDESAGPDDSAEASDDDDESGD